MTDPTYLCPSPDDCPFVAETGAELAEHVNAEHAGEWRRDDWPDTPAGRAGHASDISDEIESAAE